MIQVHQSPFFDERRLQMVVLHGTQVSMAQTHAIFMGQTTYEASSHYVIDRDGTTHQYIDIGQRAWHAGRSYWGGFTDLNSISLGIEMVVETTPNFAQANYTTAQYQALVTLLQPIMLAHKIKPHMVLGHQDIAPTRKTDPGPLCDWALLAQHGIGVWHGQSPDAADSVLLGDQAALATLHLASYGYDVRDVGAAWRAFQAHFLPWLFNSPLFGYATHQSQHILQILQEHANEQNG